MCTVRDIEEAIREHCQSQHDMESTEIDQVAVLKGTLLKELAQLVGHDKAVVLVAGPCGRLIRQLDAAPAAQFVDHAAGQRDAPLGIAGLGGVDDDLGTVAVCRLLIFRQPVDRAANLHLPARQVDVLPLEGQQLADPQPGGQVQPDKDAIAMVVAGLHDRPLLVVGEDGDLGFLLGRQRDRLAGIADQQPLLDGLLQTFVQRHQHVAQRFWGEFFLPVFVVEEILQQGGFELFQGGLAQHPVMPRVVTLVADEGALLDPVPHVGVQPVVVPLVEVQREWVAPAVHPHIVGLFLQDGDGFLPGVAAGGGALGFASFVVHPGRQAHFPPAVAALADVAFVVAAARGFVGFHIRIFHVVTLLSLC